MVKIKIDGKDVVAHEGQTILQVARNEGIYIPTLCYLKEYGPSSSCRICLVEVKGQRNLVTACSFKVFDGMEVITNSKTINDARRTNIELILSNHNLDCGRCSRDGACELQTLSREYKADAEKFKGAKTETVFDDSNPCIVRDNSKCILCKKCVLACNNRQSVYAIKPMNRGFNTVIGCAFKEGLKDSPCVGCGQCVLVCPTGALTENFNIKNVEKALKDKSKHVVIAPAPAVRVALGEEFGYPEGESVEGILPTILRELGFSKVFDINFSADLTIMEEGKEFIERLNSGENLPLFTSCCPAWVDFQKKYYPEFDNNVSTCKSPQQMFGSVVKTYYAKLNNIDPKDIIVVSVMPCTAKKGELNLPSMQNDYGKDVDYSLTVRELAFLIQKNRIDIRSLKESSFDSLLGTSSGAGVIFASTGGVMEAALRTVSEILEGKELDKIDYTSLRGLEGTRFATLQIAGKTIKVAVVSGLKNTRELLEKIKNKEVELDFVEVMSCPGGCVNGGGMPRKTADELNNSNIVEPRRKAIYNIDKNRQLRKSHQNPEVIDFYKWQEKSPVKANLHTTKH